MSPLARLNRLSARLHFSRPVLAISTVSVLLIAAPQLAAAGPPASGKVAGALSISSVSQNEGTGGTTIFTFNVTHTGTSDPFSVTVATDRTFSGSDEATADDDYTSKTEAFDFNGTDGETKTFNVAVKADSEVESDEFFQVETVSFSAVGAPVLGLPQNCPCVGLGEIKNDDAATTNTTVSIGNATGPEGDEGDTTNFNFTLTRSGDPGAFTVDVATADAGGSKPATAGVDYVAKTQKMLSFGANDTTKTFSVVMNGDTEDEEDEQFFVELSNAQGATIGDGRGLGTIEDEASDNDGGGGGGDDGGGDDSGGGGDGPTFTISPSERTFDSSSSFGVVTVKESVTGAFPGVEATEPWLVPVHTRLGPLKVRVDYFVDTRSVTYKQWISLSKQEQQNLNQIRAAEIKIGDQSQEVLQWGWDYSCVDYLLAFKGKGREKKKLLETSKLGTKINIL